MVLLDASTKWSHVCLISIRNVAFTKLLAQIIKLRAQFPDYSIKTIIFDNSGVLPSKPLITDYFMSIGIKAEHHVVHNHTQNGLAKSLIKSLQLIARSLLMKTGLHAIMHVASLVRFRLTLL